MTSKGSRAGAPAAEPSPIDRVSADDLVSLATDVGASPMQVGAVLVLEPGADIDAGALSAAVAERIRAVPRLRQRLDATPPGCGRPVWVDDSHFDIDEHVRAVRCPAPGDEEALLKVAAQVITTRLPMDRPLWRMAVVSGLEQGRSALIVAFHHVLADGIGGLAVLANLVDGTTTEPADEPGPGAGFPRPAPDVGALALDAARTRLTSVAHLPASLRRIGAALTQLRPAATSHAPRCSLNQPTGQRRRFVVVRADLDGIRDAAHAHGATVNDIVLAAVSVALGTLLHGRGETVDRFVVSVPVSARQHASATELGNQSGVIPIALPTSGRSDERIAAIAAATRAAKQTPGGASTAVLGPVFRLLARLGIFRWFIDHQHLVHTFVTNLRGPDERLSFLGATVLDVIAIAGVAGNVTLSFAVLSYAGALDITLIADPDACPDLDVLAAALRHELDELIGGSEVGPG